MRGDDGTEMLRGDGEKSDAQTAGDAGEVEAGQPEQRPDSQPLEEGGGSGILGSPRSDGYEETIAATMAEIVDAHDASGLLEALDLPVEPDGPIDDEDPASTPSPAASEDGVISLEEAEPIKNG